MRILRITMIAALLLFAACAARDDFQADVPTSSPPIVTRVDPNAGSHGTLITIFGLGFSISYPEDIVIIGGAATSAIEYRLLENPLPGEIEAITARVPDGSALGEGPIFVQVHGDQSNSDVSFTVTP